MSPGVNRTVSTTAAARFRSCCRSTHAADVEINFTLHTVADCGAEISMGNFDDSGSGEMSMNHCYTICIRYTMQNQKSVVVGSF